VCIARKYPIDFSDHCVRNYSLAVCARRAHAPAHEERDHRVQGNKQETTMPTYQGTAGNDARIGSTNNVNNFLNFGEGADTLTGGNRNDTFVLTVDQWADSINGGNGRDLVDYSNADRGVWVDLGTGTTQAIYRVPGLLSDFVESQGGNLGFPVITTTLSNIEDVRGSAYGDRLVGSDGDNVIEGGGGADIIDGGAGVDTASYANSSEGVYVELNGFASVNLGLDLLPHPGLGFGGDAQGDRLYSIENVIGSAHSDTLAGNVYANVLTGGEGSDTFVFGRLVGHDTITDFDARGDDHDVIQISRSWFADFNALEEHISRDDDNVVITLDDHNSITLEDVGLRHLDASDFYFF
jgi:Ca2+-binding RTX toxin-like protein